MKAGIVIHDHGQLTRPHWPGLPRPGRTRQLAIIADLDPRRHRDTVPWPMNRPQNWSQNWPQNWPQPKDDHHLFLGSKWGGSSWLVTSTTAFLQALRSIIFQPHVHEGATCTDLSMHVLRPQRAEAICTKCDLRSFAAVWQDRTLRLAPTVMNMCSNAPRAETTYTVCPGTMMVSRWHGRSHLCSCTRQVKREGGPEVQLHLAACLPGQDRSLQGNRHKIRKGWGDAHRTKWF